MILLPILNAEVLPLSDYTNHFIDQAEAEKSVTFPNQLAD